MKTKAFDCLEMKRRGALRIHEETKDLTFEEKVEYWRRRSEKFRHEQRKSSVQKRKRKAGRR